MSTSDTLLTADEFERLVRHKYPPKDEDAEEDLKAMLWLAAEGRVFLLKDEKGEPIVALARRMQ
jgi:hypothetical protein